MIQEATPAPMKARPAKPFPGLYPTRIYINLMMKGDKHLNYLGKPSWNTYRWLQAAYASKNYTGKYCVMEFDKAGPIFLRLASARGMATVQRSSKTLCLHYHPEFGVPDQNLSWMGYREYSFSPKKNGIYQRPDKGVA